jgi:hypothetical protein
MSTEKNKLIETEKNIKIEEKLEEEVIIAEYILNTLLIKFKKMASIVVQKYSEELLEVVKKLIII